MSTNHILKLVEALLECPSLKDRNSLSSLLNRLPSKISNAIPHGSTNLEQVTKIVETCSKYPNGLTELVFFDDGTIPLQQVEELISNLGRSSRLLLEKEIDCSLLSYLPNRQDQRFKLGEAIRAHSNHQRPLICLIYGEAQECSDMFIKCLEKENLAKLAPKQVQEGIKPCPFDCDKFTNVNQLHKKMLAGLGEQLCNDTFASRGEVAQAVMREQRLVILSTNFCHQDWRRGKGINMIHGFLDFWEDWPNVVNQKHLILVCLTVNYQTDAKTSLLRRLFKTPSPHQEIREAFANLEKNLNRQNVVILPELESVEQQQVENWARVRVQESCDNVDEILPKIQELFKKRATQRMAMQPLARELKKMLQEC